ncbi:Glutaminase liver isoform, mitochondrial [Folsomia candida]|uniref:glutaminase n=1 Tax=Folsomia candida TaxID=158441 RepID=A0A226DZC7_FOLCA|nr:Glutaminase liver isoform, mitochondrial [Folsomia candida]
MPFAHPAIPNGSFSAASPTPSSSQTAARILHLYDKVYETENLREGEATRKTVTFKEDGAEVDVEEDDMSSTRGGRLSIPTPTFDGRPEKQRDRSASLVWVDFLTAPSDTSPFSTDDESDGEESSTGRQYGTLKKSTRIDDAIFNQFSDGSDHILIGKFLAMLENAGLKRTDYRLHELFQSLRRILKEQEAIHRGHMNDNFVGSIETLHITRDVFQEVIIPNIFIISTAYRNHFIIPKFDLFCQMVEDIFLDCKDITAGTVAPYLNKLALVNPTCWGVSFCSIDGQRYSVGDSTMPVTLHALSKPLMYAYALQEIGKVKVHKYVGQEPSGYRFNELVLDPEKRPHNPIINAGSLMIHALLQQFCHPELSSAERFDETHRLFEKLSGGEYVGFSNGMFLNKRQASDRNWALVHFMKEHNCFPPGIDLADVIEYYLQTSSMETTVDVLSVIASTFANGGICPITGQRVLSEEVVADVLSVMFSCGMLEFSGKFAFRVGLPAKSSIAGVILLVIPNVGGFAVWSPPLDKFGNSVRGVEFCEKLVKTFNFHCFDVDKRGKIDPTRRTYVIIITF